MGNNNNKKNNDLFQMVLDLENDVIHGDSTIFSTENTALDTRTTLQSALNCPFEYISKVGNILFFK